MSKAAESLRVISWNVNGVRAAADKGLMRKLGRLAPDIVGLQEVRAQLEQLPPGVRRPRNYRTHFVAAERKGYSGVGLLSKQAPDEVHGALGAEHFDVEGRFQLARFGALWLANVYFPNGNGQQRDNSRVPFKLEFYRAVFRRLEADFRAGVPILVMGDFNTAHTELDLARPRQNRETSGFLEQERAELSRWFAAGWVDTFRRFESEGGHYTWWSQRQGVREKNIGWRIDYVLASPGAVPYLREAHIFPQVMGSDHCPIGVDLDPAVTQARVS